MKKYNNIPLKERKRNADRCYQHEARAEKLRQERETKEEKLLEEQYYEAKCRLYEQLPKDTRTDKERQEDEAFARLKEVAGRSTE